MEINSLQSIFKGLITNLPWKSSRVDMEKKYPQTININKEVVDFGAPFLVIDNVEFYYENEDFTNLAQVIIQAWKIDKKDKNTIFNHGWINGGLKFKNVIQKLNEENVEFTTKENAIILNSGARFLFYNMEDNPDEEELCKIVLD